MVQTDEERKAKKKALGQTPKAKARAKAYNSRPERKVKQKEVRDKPEYKAKAKLREQTPEYKAKRKEYNSQPEAKAKRKAYQQTSEYKAMKKEYTKAYISKPENKIKRATTRKIRNSRPEIKAHNKAYNQMPENGAKVKKTREGKRLKILQHYSLNLSNSDKPCCHCCGENFHSDFLAIDHVLGRVEMESIPELIAIGYSSKLEGENLMRWIVKNNFPEGFKILCHNCNMAKGMKKNNNKCPHERK